MRGNAEELICEVHLDFIHALHTFITQIRLVGIFIYFLWNRSDLDPVQ